MDEWDGWCGLMNLCWLDGLLIKQVECLNE